MNAAAFLAFHDSGVGGLLGMRFVETAPDRVVATMAITPSHLTGPDRVHGGVIMALADSTAAYGAVLNLPEGRATATIESKTNFLRAGSGPELRAVATPLHVGRTVSVWRTQVARGGVTVAEVTQTQLYFEARDAAPAADREAPEAAGRETPAEAAEARPGASVTLLDRGPARPRRGGAVDDRKRQIFEAACQVIARKGFANASIREIAAAAGMPVPTMYQYIQGKGDLLLIIYQHFMDDLGRSMREAQDPALPPMESFRAVLAATLTAIDETQRYIRLMFQETKSLDREMRRQVFDLDRQNIEILRALLAEAKAAGACDCGDEEVAANLVYFLCTIWPLRHWAMESQGRDAVNRQVMDFVLKALARPA